MKKKLMILGLILPILLSLPISIVHSQILNIWDVRAGNVRYYYFSEVYTGNVTGISTLPPLEYHILLNEELGQFFPFYNTSGTDIYLRILMLTKSPVENLLTLYDDSYTNSKSDFIFDQDNLNSFFNLGVSGKFVLPVRNGSTFFIAWNFPWGDNWTICCQEINSDPNYNCSWSGNLLIVNCTKNNVLDPNLNMHFNLTKRIVWDNSTGFLVSLSMKKFYENKFCTITTTITSSYSYSSLSAFLSMGPQDIFWPIAFQ